MRLLVCGGRDFNDKERLHNNLDLLHRFYNITAIIHGNARGADSLAGQWARDNNVQECVYPADWNKHGRRAGPIRNQQMLIAGKPSAVLACPGGKGTADMIKRATDAGIRVQDLDWARYAATNNVDY